MHTWRLKYTGPSECSGTLTGDPLTALMCSRETGTFHPSSDSEQRWVREGWTAGILTAVTKSCRVFKASVIARNGGQWQWAEGAESPGTRHFDFLAWEGYEVEVEADKPANESAFARQLATHGWVAK